MKKKIEVTKKNQILILNNETSNNLLINLYAETSAIVYDFGQNGFVSCHLDIGSQLDYYFIISNSVQKKIEIFFDGEYSKANINGVSLLNKKQNCSFVVEQNHFKDDTKSFFKIRSILGDSSNLYQKGTIFISKEAKNIKALQNSKAIILSPNSKIKSLPELEVHNKNVQCSHGSAIGCFDKDQLFYLRSRGLSEKKSKHLLANGFLNEMFVGLKDRKVKKDFFEKINKKLQELM